VALRGRQLLEPRQQLGLAVEVAVAADAVDRAVASRRDDPGPGVGRDAVARPTLERDRERVLDRVLGPVEIAEDTGQVRKRASPLLPEDALDGLYAPTSASRITTGRTSTTP
jgi:hypothetical protein